MGSSFQTTQTSGVGIKLRVSDDTDRITHRLVQGSGDICALLIPGRLRAESSQHGQTGGSAHRRQQ